MSSSDPQLLRIARQHLKTSVLQGVDFMPLSASHPTESVEAPAGNAGTSTREVPAALIETRANIAAVSASVAHPRAASVGSKAERLAELRHRHDKTCPHCTSVTYHTQTVFGEGDPNARLMFIGEAPGEEEDRTGRPFVGRAGQKLNDIIKAMGLAREQVFIANILKSRPPENRTPLQHEVEACGPFLTEQIRIIQPAAIVALGGPSAKYLLRTETGITRLRGQWGVFEDGDVKVPVMPTFHPAYLLRAYTPENRKLVWHDMQMVLDRLKEI